MKPFNRVLSRYGTTIFETMSRLAIAHNAINLGQGFPDGNGPDDVRRIAIEALDDRPNQYPPMMGIPELRQAVAAHDRAFYGLEYDWQSEILVGSGATELLADCIFGLVNPGDEVILLEPLYDSYLPILQLVGAVPKLVRLEPPDWVLPKDALAAAFSEKTKAILLNSPQNPAGKVYSGDELAFIADLLKRHDVFAICDEVYEHIVFSGRAHLPLAALPGMRERSLRIGSAGKTFSLTGWKVGYVSADRQLLQAVAKAHQFVTFTTPPNLQRAIAYGLGKERRYFEDLAADIERKRDYFAAALKDIGFSVAPSDGTYFLNADFRPLGFNGDDHAFCEMITTKAGVAAVPVSAFYQPHASGDLPPQHFARFCFCKDDAVLEKAADRLAAYFR